MRAGAPGSPGPNVVSISDMDVHALKSLHTPGSANANTNGSGASAAVAPNAGPGTPGSPNMPLVDAGGSGPGTFSVEAFAMRVQALIGDDRALMERLIRFAQAHDMLKKNAERAQKLAQDSNAALETYQRQVRTLEEQLARSDGLYAPFSLPPLLCVCAPRGCIDLGYFFCFLIGRSRSSSWLRRNSRWRRPLRSRLRRCASSPRRTRRCLRARCSSRTRRRRRKRSCARSTLCQSANRSSGSPCSRRSTSCKRKTGVCASSSARLGRYSDSGRVGGGQFAFHLWQLGDAAVPCFFLSCFTHVSI